MLRADGKLYIRDRDDLDTETEITGVFDLDGRISIVDFNTYIILTSEGADQGFWIDLRDDNIVAYPFGFDGPGPSSITVAAVTEVPDGVDTELTTSARYIKIYTRTHYRRHRNCYAKTDTCRLTPNRYYHYRWTYISLASPNDPWYGQESNPSLEADVQQDETQRGILQTDAGVPGHSLFFLQSERKQVQRSVKSQLLIKNIRLLHIYVSIGATHLPIRLRQQNRLFRLLGIAETTY